MSSTKPMDNSAMQAEIARLLAENEALRKITEAKLTIKLTEKGGISVYGLGRWPVTMYAQQWRILMGHSEAIARFLDANAAKLGAFEAAWAAAKAQARTTSEAEALAKAVDLRLAKTA